MDLETKVFFQVRLSFAKKENSALIFQNIPPPLPTPSFDNTVQILSSTLSEPSGSSSGVNLGMGPYAAGIMV
jgi:hypothetical protein